MKRSEKVALLVVLTGLVLLPASTLFGATLKPLPVVAANSTTIQPLGGPASDGPGFNGNPAIRDLRTDFVRTWHVFADTVNDAILDPGDTRVGEFKNWWTPVSAATQHGHQIGAPPVVTPSPAGFDYPSTPIDHQNNYTTNTTIGLPQKANTIGFYLTYSHVDNANFDTEFYSDGTPHDTFQQRNRERNGYAMGWLIGETVVDGQGNVELGAGGGDVKMDIFIHNGKSRNAGGVGPDDNHNFGTNTSGQQVWYGPTAAVAPGAAYSGVSQSDPQVVQSNEMSLLARQADDLMLVADYRDELVITNPSSQTGYTYGPNSTGYIFTDAAGDFNKGKYLVGDPNWPAGIPMHLATAGEFDTVIGSMDVREVNSYRTTPGGANDDLGGVIAPIHAADTPQALLDAGVKDGQGIDHYLYEDSFFVRDGLSNDGAPWVEGSTDGGVIAGLSGYDDYSQFYSLTGPQDPRLFSHWGGQQVIRIDFDKDTFDLGALRDSGITEIIFYDWGDPDPVTGQQAKPTAAAQQIVINIDSNLDLYFETGITPGASPDDIYFPENRIYIAQVEYMPEPATMIVLAIGGSALLARRRSRRGLK